MQQRDECVCFALHSLGDGRLQESASSKGTQGTTITRSRETPVACWKVDWRNVTAVDDKKASTQSQRLALLGAGVRPLSPALDRPELPAEGQTTSPGHRQPRPSLGDAVTALCQEPQLPAAAPTCHMGIVHSWTVLKPGVLLTAWPPAGQSIEPHAGAPSVQ